jgi:pimeloyl-ACP methyl ester carboxylesterase/DNA-binding CsgD family transcriptional regulator
VPNEMPSVAFARPTDGVTIAYVASGEGTPLVLMPAKPLGNVSGEWQVPLHREAFMALGRQFRLIQYDSRGSGRSQRDVDDVSPAAMHLDLDAVLAACGASRCALVSMYLGCTVGIAYALNHPDRVSHLVLFGGSARGWDAMGARQTQALLSLIEQDWDTFIESAVHAWLGPAEGETGRLQADAMRDSTTPAITRRVLQAGSGIDLTDRLGELAMPVLVFHRRGARQVPIEVSESLAAAAPQGRLRVLEGSIASILLEDFDSVLRDLVNFTGGHVTVAPPQKLAARSDLTPRETQVLRLLAQGETNAEIGHRLEISVHTVERHVANLYRKIEARGRADATAYAVRRGLA